MKITTALEEFLLDQKVRGNSPATIEFYTRVLTVFLDFIGREAETSDITLKRCKEYYLYLSDRLNNSVSIQSYVRGARAFLNYLYASEVIGIDLCQKFKLPKAQRKIIDVLTDEELHRVFRSLSAPGWLSSRNRLIVSLMLDSGLRLHEVVSLTVRAVHEDERYLIVQEGKGNKQRIVPFGSTTAAVLREYLEATSFWKNRAPLIIKVSDDPPGYEAITDTTLKQFFRKLKLRSGVDRLHPHLLRHTFATRYLENGGNIYTLQAILGHTSLEMVKRYLHLANSRIRADFPKFSPLDNLGK